MAGNRSTNQILIGVVIIVLSFGSAVTYTLAAGAGVTPAQVVHRDQSNAPEITRYYVAKSGDNTAPTEGWHTAYRSLQDAILIASFKSGRVEIWVSEGVYYPDEGEWETPDSQLSTFHLLPNVALYGGFDTDDTEFSDRDWVKNVTVLSGDIDKNDETNDDGVVTSTDDIEGENAYHVVTADGTGVKKILNDSIIDGFTITAGKADKFDTNMSGGGFYCNGAGKGSECSPSLQNIKFFGNFALYKGGGMFNDGRRGESSPVITNVFFWGNEAIDYGGAMVNNADFGNSNPSLLKVSFFDNRAQERGGAMHNFAAGFSCSSSPSLVDVVFYRNSADQGGAISNQSILSGSSSPNLTNVIIYGNWTTGEGGAMYNIGIESGISSPRLVNALFTKNSAESDGGAVYNTADEDSTSGPVFTNVTFSGNESKTGHGGAMYNISTGGTNEPVLRNSILWNNLDSSGEDTLSSSIHNDKAEVHVFHSLVQGTGASGSGWTSDSSFIDEGGNIDIDPMFVTPVNPQSANLRLRYKSPAIDAGDNTYITGVNEDLEGNPRILDGNLDGTATVDMGAYETPYSGFLPVIFR